MCGVSSCSGCVIARNYKATVASSCLLAKQVAKLGDLADRYACVSGSQATNGIGFWRGQGGPGQLLERLRSGSDLEHLLVGGLYIQGSILHWRIHNAGDAGVGGCLCLSGSDGVFTTIGSGAAALGTHMFRSSRNPRQIAVLSFSASGKQK